MSDIVVVQGSLREALFDVNLTSVRRVNGTMVAVDFPKKGTSALKAVEGWAEGSGSATNGTSVTGEKAALRMGRTERDSSASAQVWVLSQMPEKVHHTA